MTFHIVYYRDLSHSAAFKFKPFIAGIHLLVCLIKKDNKN